MGFMAAGKTTIGRHLARELGMPFVDTDEIIVARSGPIAELFAHGGEPRFREAEYAAVREALAGPLAVIALGGGAVTYPPTQALLAAAALRVYLDISAETLTTRLRRSRTIRPLVGAAPTVEHVRGLLAAREPAYRAADLSVRGPYQSKLAFARGIVAALERHVAAARVPAPGGVEGDA
ncbi:MAG: shikimate kinase AroK [Vulcanimicrobiaceae bacterium]